MNPLFAEASTVPWEYISTMLSISLPLTVGIWKFGGNGNKNLNKEHAGFITSIECDKLHKGLDARLDRIENKLDRLVINSARKEG